MKDVQQTKRPVRKLYSKPVLLLLLVVIFLMAKATWGVYLKEKESRQNVAIVQSELAGLQKRQALLKDETEKLNSEEGVEEAIRKKFQVSKEGESVLVVVDKPLPQSVTEENKNFFSKMWDSVSGIFKKKSDQAVQ